MLPRKRPAASSVFAGATAATRPSRPELAGAARQKCKEVIEAIRSDKDIPERVCRMFDENLGACFAVPKAERHAFLEQFAGMAGEALAGAQASLRARVGEARAGVAEANSARQSREAVHEAAAAAAGAEAAAVKVRQAALAEGGAAVRRARAHLAEAKEKHQSLEAKLAETERQKDRLESIARDSYPKLKDGGLDQDGRRALARELVSLGQACQFDSSLLLAIPGALAKQAAERSGFDTIVVDRIGHEAAAHVARLAGDALAGAAAGRESAREFVGAQAELAAATEHVEACARDLSASQDLERAALGSTRAAARALGAAATEVDQAAQQCKAAEAALARFEQGPLASFESLRDGA